MPAAGSTVPQAPPSAGRAPAPCRRCDGATWVIDESGEAVPCVCRDDRVRRARTLRARTSLPQLYREHAADLDRPPVVNLDGKLRRAIHAYVERLERHLAEGRGMWFTGGAATGKTCAAVAIAKEAERRGRTIGFRTVPDLLTRIRATFDDSSRDTYDEYVTKLGDDLDLLVLDDLGAERANEWVLEQLYVVINRRLLAKRSVIVTTNLSVAELERQVQPRVVSRLYEMCGQPLEFDGPDHRREQAQDWLTEAAVSATAS